MDHEFQINMQLRGVENETIDKRDKQKEDRGFQRQGADSSGRETMNRDRERVERPTLSEQKDVETKLHSSNTESGRPTPVAKPQRRN